MTFNLKPSQPDDRDFEYTRSGIVVKESVDLREWDSLVEHQGDLGSCEGEAITGAYELMLKKQIPEKYTELSSLFVYYNSRLFQNEELIDAGAYIRDGLKSLKKYGVCSEAFWPYHIEKFDDKPPLECYVDALERIIPVYYAIHTIEDMLEVLNFDIPIVIGMETFHSFHHLNQADFIVKMPAENETSTGSHAMSIIGYNLKNKTFLAKNSYGETWGNNGYCEIPFEYIDLHVFEKWSFEIRL